jgi:Vacuolar protein sorting-associated protein 62/Insecticidal Crystal Toxin, P42
MNFFRIVNAFTKKAVTPPGWSKEIGKVMVQFDDNGTEDHLWSQVAAKDGAVKIVNAHTKLWIGLNAAGKVIQGNEESDRFYWMIKPEPNNVEQVRIFNKATNQALTPIGWSKDNGAEITVWSDEGGCHTIDHVWSLLGNSAPEVAVQKNALVAPMLGKTLISNGLEITFVTDFNHIWNDGGSGAKDNVSCWEPILSNGFQALGHYAHNTYDAPKSVMVAVKGLKSGVVAYPTDYNRIWGDWGSGGRHDGSFWEPVPPQGYYALGSVVVSGYNKPPLNKVVCIHQDYVESSSVAAKIWNDAGSGANEDVSIYGIKSVTPDADNEAYLSAGSFCGHRSHNKLDASNIAYVLKIQIPRAGAKINQLEPKLKSINFPETTLKKELSMVTYVPCVAVVDSRYENKLKAQIAETPFYRLERYDYYELIADSFLKNDTWKATEGKWAVTKGMSTEDSTSMSHTVGVSFSAEVQASPLGLGASYSTTLSYAFAYETTHSKTNFSQTTVEVPIPLPAKGCGAIFSLVQEYVLIRNHDNSIVRNKGWKSHSAYTLACFPDKE